MKSYLSWSQLSTFERSPSLYVRMYFEGERLDNKYLRFGKKLANRLETGEPIKDNPPLEMAASLLPSSPVREYKLIVDYDGILLLSKLDGFDEKKLILREVKSGKRWTQNMVDRNDQITFYATAIWKKFKRLPRKIYLDWVETDELDNGAIIATGRVKTFETVRTLEDIVRFRLRIKNAWRGIRELSREYAAVHKV